MTGKIKNSIKRILLTGILMFFCCNLFVFSQQLVKPYTFNPGDIISSSQMNENFDKLYNRGLASMSDVDTTGLTVGGILKWNGINWYMADDLLWQKDLILEGNLIVHGGVYILGGNGDVNNDGRLDNVDSILVAQYLGGLAELTELQYLQADINGDCRVTMTDSYLIAGVYTGMYTMDQAHHRVGKRAIDSAISITVDGNVGIGELQPLYKMDVVGTVRVKGLIIDGSSYTLGGNGDTDGDGIITLTDSLKVAHYISGIQVLSKEEYARADINGDGKVTMTDCKLIAMVYSGACTLDQANHSVGKHITDSAVSIEADGNVGIGEIEPKRKLHVTDVMRLEPRSASPSDPAEGDIYYDSTLHKLMCYDGADWMACF